VRRCPVVDGHKFDRVHQNLTFTNNQPEVFCLGCAKDAFLQFDAELVLAQMLENQPNMRDVFVQVSRVHHEVVHVDDEPSFRKVVSEDIIHECLKGRLRVALAEEHNCRFVEPVRSSESGLPLVGLLNLNIVIPPPDIEFGEILGVFESVDEVGDMRKRVSILDHMRVYVAIVLTGLERSILL